MTRNCNISKSGISFFFIGILFLAIGITSCSKDDVPGEVTPSEKKITSFAFLLTENPLNVNVIGQIDEGAKTISAIMPEGTYILTLSNGMGSSSVRVVK